MMCWLTAFDERRFAEICGFLACCEDHGFRIRSRTLEIIRVARNLGKPLLIWTTGVRNSIECQ